MTRRAIILTWPDHTCAPELLFWFLNCAGLAWDEIEFLRVGNGATGNAIAYNAAIRCGIESGADAIWIADRDTRPHPINTAPILTSPLDVACVASPRECGDCWRHPEDFHAGLFRLRRSVAVTIGLPAFHWPTSADGSELRGCCCAPFADKARRLGYTVGHAGTASHAPRTTDGLVNRFRLTFTNPPLVRNA